MRNERTRLIESWWEINNVLKTKVYEYFKKTSEIINEYDDVKVLSRVTPIPEDKLRKTKILKELTIEIYEFLLKKWISNSKGQLNQLNRLTEKVFIIHNMENRIRRKLGKKSVNLNILETKLAIDSPPKTLLWTLAPQDRLGEHHQDTRNASISDEEDLDENIQQDLSQQLSEEENY